MTETRVINCHTTEKYDVYIGRPSKWGNPYSHHRTKSLAQYQVLTLDEALRKYEEYVRASPHLMAALPELRGKTLGCFCKPRPCHGDILIKLLRELDDDEATP